MNKENAEVHKGYTCDNCETSPIKGIRYKCSQCPDFDLCQACESKGAHSHHTFLKIRKVAQAPVHFMCQYPGENLNLPFPSMHFDQTIDLEVKEPEVPEMDSQTPVFVIQEPLVMPTIPESFNKLSISEAFNEEGVLGESMEIESAPVEDLAQEVSELPTKPIVDEIV